MWQDVMWQAIYSTLRLQNRGVITANQGCEPKTESSFFGRFLSVFSTENPLFLVVFLVAPKKRDRLFSVGFVLQPKATKTDVNRPIFSVKNRPYFYVRSIFGSQRWSPHEIYQHTHTYSFKMLCFSWFHQETDREVFGFGFGFVFFS